MLRLFFWGMFARQLIHLSLLRLWAEVSNVLGIHTYLHCHPPAGYQNSQVPINNGPILGASCLHYPFILSIRPTHTTQATKTNGDHHCARPCVLTEYFGVHGTRLDMLQHSVAQGNVAWYCIPWDDSLGTCLLSASHLP